MEQKKEEARTLRGFIKDLSFREFMLLLFFLGGIWGVDIGELMDRLRGENAGAAQIEAIEKQTVALEKSLGTLTAAVDTLQVYYTRTIDIVEQDRGLMRQLRMDFDSLARAQLQGFAGVDGYLKAIARRDTTP